MKKLLLIILLFAIFASFALNKPAKLDEIMAVGIIENIKKNNIPSAYVSEDLPVYMLPAFHPTLTFYIISLGYNSTEISMRIVPMIFCIGCIVLVYLISKYIFNKKVALISTLLFALSPLVVKNSTLLSNDVVLLFFTLFLVYIFLVSYERGLNTTRTLLIFFLTVVMFWTKFANIPILFISLFLYSVFSKKLKIFLKIMIICLSGALLFAGMWYVYTQSLGVPFSHFLISNAKYADANNLISIFSLESTLLRIWTIKNVMFWTTPFFLILVVFALINRIKEYFRERKIIFLDFFIIFSCLAFLQYFFLYPSSYGFPKHFVAMVPGFSILIAHYISKFKFHWKWSTLLISIILVGTFSFLVLKDPFIEHNIFYNKSITVQDNLDEYIKSNLKGVLFFVPFFIVFVVMLRKNIYHSIVFSMFITIILSSLYIDFIQAKADYSTKCGYGESGFLETAEYIKEHTTENDLIISRPSIAYYAQRRYYLSYPSPDPPIRGLRDFMNVTEVNYPNNINKLIKDSAVPYVVMSHLEKGIYPEPEYYKVAKYGSFTIYKRR